MADVLQLLLIAALTVCAVLLLAACRRLEARR